METVEVAFVGSSSPPQRELFEGQILLGKYRITRKVGEGGFGRVYEAEELASQQRVALKIGRSPEHEGRMAREARLAAMLTSPHSVRILGAEQLEDGSPLIVMELLQGISLREYLAMRGLVEPELAVEWALQLAEALQEAHSVGLVHRDLKPSNLFLVEKGADSRQLKLLDFGLARAPGSADEYTITGGDVVLGSPAYMSPEQIRSGEVTARSDIWSFGVVLYEMLAGRRPFQAETNAGLYAAIVADAPEPLANVRACLSPQVLALVERCLRKHPGERFATMEELTEALRAARAAPLFVRSSRGSEPITETLPVPTLSPARAGRLRLNATAVGLLLTGLALGTLFWVSRSPAGADPAADPAKLPAVPEPAAQREAPPVGPQLAAPSEVPGNAQALPPPQIAPEAPREDETARKRTARPRPEQAAAHPQKKPVEDRPFFASPDF